MEEEEEEEEEEEDDDDDDDDKLRGKIHLKYKALIITNGHFYAQSLQSI